MLKADGLDDAIIGIAMSFGRPDVLCYDVKKIVSILVSRDGMSEDEAYEFFDYNILGSYNGEGMPVFLTESHDEY
tara:strand:+ start:365 stop:589 length:225 start_codon:yes stop_codon:yes gene_type:complete